MIRSLMLSLALPLLTSLAVAQTASNAQVTGATWGGWIQESGKDSGGTSSYVCPSNQVMTGRQHSGDENGNTRYQCATITVEGMPFAIPSAQATWGSWIQESGKYSGGTSSYVCPSNQVMTGRQHSGDENGNTRYQCAPMAFQGGAIQLASGTWGSWIKESGKDSGGTSSYICPSNQVMTGRQHSGDENGNTRYQCAEPRAPYATIELQWKYIGENTGCVWQNNVPRQLCPPYVWYLNAAQLKPLQLHVSGGLLVNSLGVPFDTSYAGASHSANAAIFVMNQYGTLYASNAHPVFMFHHSSFYAGDRVASAGELVVKNGVIQTMSNCSGHYTPPTAFGNQAVQALKNQGYSATINFVPCSAPLEYDRLLQQ